MGSGVFSTPMPALVDRAALGRWRVVEICRETAGDTTLVEENELQMYLEFSDGYVTLKAGGCGIGGDIEVDGGRYQVLRYLTTSLRHCEPEARAQEHRLYAAFYDKGQYTIEGSWLTLTDMAGRTKLRATRTP